MSNKPTKKLLLIRASSDVLDNAILDIYCHAHHYGIKANHKDVTTLDELSIALSDGQKYDYLYFAAHGSSSCFGDNKTFIASWTEIGTAICSSDCLNENAIVMLYCCKGGINTVTYQLMAACPNIQYVCGAKQNMTNIDLIVGFNVFIYNIENRNTDPIISAQKATQATDIRFECFDRDEVESSPLYYYNYCHDCVRESS